MTHGPLKLAQDLVADWKDQAACGGYPNALFFPGADASSRTVERAQAVCAVCRVAEECLEYAFETNQRSGIWAGTTENERKSLRRKWLASRRRSA
ncbi:MAG: WhiB family transcriptional regulator [Acidimicrobiia bacterium]